MSLAPDDLRAWLPDVIEIAATACDAIMQVYGAADASPEAMDVAYKSDSSPLTAADTAAHRVIVEALRDLTPDVPVLSEESALLPFRERASWERFWLVDPLDGTKEFIKRNGEFTVNIALVEDHRPTLGVVAVPVTRAVYWGADGVGAFKASLDDIERPVPVSVSPTAARPPRIVGSRSHSGPRFDAFLAALGDHEVVSIGSSLKCCLVAEGVADAYPRFGLTSEWDTAAAQAVVEAAGGAIVDQTGRALRYNTGESVLNPEFVVYGPTDVDWLSYLPD